MAWLRWSVRWQMPGKSRCVSMVRGASLTFTGRSRVKSPRRSSR
jgi:hypothetical protein